MSEEKNLIRRKGSFKHVSRIADLFSALLLVGALFLAVIFILSLINFGEEINMLIRRAAAVCIIMEGAFAAIRIISSLGREYSYEAGETDFVVTDQFGEREYFYYSDVTSVSYTPIHKKHAICGYAVEIATGMRRVSYRFHFGTNAENTSTAATPFYCLEVNSGLREPEEVNADSGLIMQQFERMQRHQDIRKKRITKTERMHELYDVAQAESEPSDINEQQENAEQAESSKSTEQ